MKVILVVSMVPALVAGEPVRAVGQQASSIVRSYRKPSAFAGPDEVVVVGGTIAFFGQGASADDECGKCCWADLTCDAEVDLLDLREFSANWLAGI